MIPPGLSLQFITHRIVSVTIPGFQTSCDAGLYLCEFIYYRGLREMKGNSIFVHVPPMDVLPSEQAAKTIKDIAETIVSKLTPKTAKK